MQAGGEINRKYLPHHPPHTPPNQSVIVFVTQTVRDRRPLLASQEAMRILLEAWKTGDHWLVGRYVIMPDHVHFFCAPRLTESPLHAWMQFWRNHSTRNWPRSDQKPIWQRDFFDRQLRGRESHSEKWQYLRENPVRRGLVPTADDWPWQGELNKLAWHDRA